MKAKVTEELKKTFSPEFLNRVDATVVFHALTPEQIRGIVRLEIGYLNDRLAEQGVHLTITEELEELLAEKGYDPTMGARPLRRQIRHLIEDPLAERILARPSGGVGEIIADVEDGETVFRFIEATVSPELTR